VLGAVVATVRLARPQGRGEAWQRCEAPRGQLTEWLEQGLSVVKCHQLLARRGENVAYRRLARPLCSLYACSTGYIL
jgi:hypothetical protein